MTRFHELSPSCQAYSNPLTRVRRSAAKAIRAATERDDAIRAASQAGASIRAIAAEAGLSSARVHQILHGR